MATARAVLATADARTPDIAFFTTEYPAETWAEVNRNVQVETRSRVH